LLISAEVRQKQQKILLSLAIIAQAFMWMIAKNKSPNLCRERGNLGNKDFCFSLINQ
jgi:predicted kinase